MFKWFDWVWRIIVVVIGIMVIWKFWMWWRPDPPTTYLRTDLINAQQSDAFYTGFATVALVQFDTGRGGGTHWLPEFARRNCKFRILNRVSGNQR